jgi:hypothetical protein
LLLILEESFANAAEAATVALASDSYQNVMCALNSYFLPNPVRDSRVCQLMKTVGVSTALQMMTYLFFFANMLVKLSPEEIAGNVSTLTEQDGRSRRCVGLMRDIVAFTQRANRRFREETFDVYFDFLELRAGLDALREADLLAITVAEERSRQAIKQLCERLGT